MVRFVAAKPVAIRHHRVGLSPPYAYRSRLAFRFAGDIGVEQISASAALAIRRDEAAFAALVTDALRFLESLTVARRGVAHFASKQTHERARI